MITSILDIFTDNWQLLPVSRFTIFIDNFNYLYYAVPTDNYWQIHFPTDRFILRSIHWQWQKQHSSCSTLNLTLSNKCFHKNNKQYHILELRTYLIHYISGRVHVPTGIPHNSVIVNTTPRKRPSIVLGTLHVTH